MATYDEVYAQLEGTDFIVYLALHADDPFKRSVAYKNLNGLSGTLNAAAFADLGLTYADLPAIVKGEDLAGAIKTASRTTVIWNTIDIAANGGIIATAGSGNVFSFKGSVANKSDLPEEGNSVGDVYQVSSEDYAEYVWVEKADGSFGWDPLGTAIDLQGYYTKDETDALLSNLPDSAAITEHINNAEIHVTAENKQAWDAKAEQADIDSAIAPATAHIADADLHVTAQDKQAWSGKAEQSDIESAVAPATAHISNSDLHVTAEDKASWNAKAEQSDIDSAIAPATAHIADTVSHVTAEDKESWNAKAEQSDITSAVTSAVEAIDEKFLDYNKDYTAVEVLATNAAIAAGTNIGNTVFADFITDSSVLDKDLTKAVSAKMEAVFIIRLTCPPAESDVIVDWGDGSKFNTADTDTSNDLEIDGNEYNVIVRHTYADPGRHIVKFLGKKYFGFGSKFKGATIETITCRMMASDLPIASHINAIGNLAYASYRLLLIDVPTYFLSAGMFNLNATFNNCYNLVKATVLRYFQSSVRNITWFFNSCSALTETDFIMPGYLRDGGINRVFNDCPKLAANISKLFPNSGFIGKGTYSAERAFYNCASLTGTVPASMLWENTDITWTNTTNAFTGCAPEILAQVPTSWGGTNTEIQAKLDSGYFNKVNKGMLLEATAKMPKVEFIEGGTVANPAAVNLSDCTWYIAVTPFVGTLPEAPANGTVVQISYEIGQENMTVVPAGSDTINGSQNPCLIGVSGDGTFVSNETHRFVYRSGNWILL